MAKKMSCQHEGCEKYGLLQPEANFFISQNKLMKRLPICKKCISDNLDLSKMDDIFTILQLLDYPYLHETWEKIYESYPDSVLSRYIAEIKRTPDVKNLHFSDTESMEGCSDTISVVEVTSDMRKLFGESFTIKQLQEMEKKYQFLKQDYDEITSMHTEALLTYCRYKVMEEEQTSLGNVDQAKKWGELASKASIQAGISPNQLKKADLIGGISTFSELTQIIEENADGVIPILPQMKYRPDDSADLIIYTYINYARHLEGKDLCKYEDVYKFYDDQRDAYITKTGDPFDIFKHDPTLINRERVKEFIKMPDELDKQTGEYSGE